MTQKTPIAALGVALLVALVTLVAACGGAGDETTTGLDVRPVDVARDTGRDIPRPDVTPGEVIPAPLGPCPSAALQVVHVETWPGGGLGLVVRTPTPADLRATDDAGRAWPVASRPTTAPRTLLAVVVDDPALRPDLRAALADLPADVSVALFRRCGRTEQVVGFPADAARVDAALVDDALWACPDDRREAPDTALGSVAAALARVGNPADVALRVLAWAGAPPVAPSVARSDAPLLEQGQVYAPLPDPSAVAGLVTAVAAAGEHLHRVGLCPALDEDEPLTLSLPDGTVCAVAAPTPPPGEELLPCTPEGIAAGGRAFPRRVELRFDAEERGVYDQRVRDADRTEFALGVRLGDGDVVRAVARLRGQSSIGCARKSYTVDLDGGARTHILPGVASDEFYLLSMCLDDRYFQQVTANRLAHRLGLFPLGFGLVELRVDGASHGVYLLLEKADKALEDEMARPRVIVRRRFDPEGHWPDVHLPKDTRYDEPALASYRDLPALAGQFEGEALVAALDEHVALDDVLRLLALHSILGNGDWVDELYFYGDETVLSETADSGPGGASERYGVAAWDMDDIYSECHHGGRFAIEDPWGLVYCAEGDLERAILADSAVYARYVDVLAGLLGDGLTETDVAAALDATAAELLPFFDDPAVCRAMVELTGVNPAATAPDAAKADIRAHIDGTLDDYRARRAELLGRIDHYRGAR